MPFVPDQPVAASKSRFVPDQPRDPEFDTIAPLPGTPEHDVWEQQAAAYEPPSLWRDVKDWIGSIGAANRKSEAAAAAEPLGENRAKLETAGALASGAAATPAGSLVGILTEAARGMGLTDARGEDIAERVQEALTYRPRSQRAQAALESAGAIMKPITDSGADVALAPLLVSPELPMAQQSRAASQDFKRVAQQTEKARLAQPVPTGEQIEQAAHQAYAKAGSSEAVASADDFAHARDTWVGTLDREGFDPDLHPRLNTILKRLSNTEGEQNFTDLEKIRRLTSRNALTSPEAEERRLARFLIDDIDDFQESALGEAGEAGAQARALWSAHRKGEEIEELLLRAERSASTSHLNYENAVRTEFRRLSNNPRAMRRFTPEEQGLIEQAAKGGVLRNTLRYFGKFAPAGPVSTMASVVAGGGGAGTVAVAAGGAVARKAAGNLAERDVQRIVTSIRRGAPVDPQTPPAPAAGAPEFAEPEINPALAFAEPTVQALRQAGSGLAEADQADEFLRRLEEMRRQRQDPKKNRRLIMDAAALFE